MNTNDKRNAIKWINENIDNNDNIPAFAREMFDKAKARYEKSISNQPKIDPRKAELMELVRKAREELKALSTKKEEVVEAPVEEAKPAPKVTAKK